LSESEEKKRKYIDVNIPREWEPFLNEAFDLPEVQKGLAITHRDLKPSSLGVWIIEQWLIDKTSFRFQHFNTYKEYITVIDKKLPNLYLDIYPKPDGKLWCKHDDSNDCVHVQWILRQSDLMQSLKQKGWKPK